MVCLSSTPISSYNVFRQIRLKIVIEVKCVTQFIPLQRERQLAVDAALSRYCKCLVWHKIINKHVFVNQLLSLQPMTKQNFTFELRFIQNKTKWYEQDLFLTETILNNNWCVQVPTDHVMMSTPTHLLHCWHTVVVVCPSRGDTATIVTCDSMRSITSTLTFSTLVIIIITAFSINF